MTSAEQQTIDVLLVDAPFVAAIGMNQNATVKIFPGEIPDDTELPAGSFARTDSDPEYTLDNTLVASRVSMNLLFWAKTQKEADDIADLAVVAMTAAGHALTSSTSQYEPQLDEYAALRVFDVWEI